MNVLSYISCYNNNYYKFEKACLSSTYSHSSSSNHSHSSTSLPTLKSPWSASKSEDFHLTNKDINAFKRLLDESVVREFLNWDVCNMLADNYLLATALTYFKRANMSHQQYTPVYLFVALYLAHDMQEDELDLKNDLIRFAMCEGKDKRVSDQEVRLFMNKRNKLWHGIGMRACVNKLCCQAIMESCLPYHRIWQRRRSDDHGGVSVVSHVKHSMCQEWNLRSSYVECNISCIVCSSRRFLHQKMLRLALNLERLYTLANNNQQVNQQMLQHFKHNHIESLNAKSEE